MNILDKISTGTTLADIMGNMTGIELLGLIDNACLEFVLRPGRMEIETIMFRDAALKRIRETLS